jgi:HPt (histidine-containing phosphotransfer) domain-containing protein
MGTYTDMTFLESFTGGNKEKVNKYINIFLQIYPKNLEEMKNHLSNGDYDRLRAVAHSLKPQITYMGIKGGAELIQKIEKNAGERIEVEQLPTVVNDFQTVCDKAVEELKQIAGGN